MAEFRCYLRASNDILDAQGSIVASGEGAGAVVKQSQGPDRPVSQAVDNLFQGAVIQVPLTYPAVSAPGHCPQSGGANSHRRHIADIVDTASHRVGGNKRWSSWSQPRN